MLANNSQVNLTTNNCIPLNHHKIGSKFSGLSNISDNCRLCAIKTICENSYDESQSASDPKTLLTVDQHIHHKGEAICRQGESFSCVFIVRSGTVKTYTLNEEGEMQITGFYSVGQVIGLDGIYQSEYQSTAVALDTVSICRVPLPDMHSFTVQQTQLLPKLLNLMSAELCNDKTMFLTLSKKSVEYRVASFLLNYSSALKQLRMSHNRFNLPMTRNDLGNYLGMAVETVSREFTRLQSSGMIRVAQREIHILDRQKFKQMIGIFG